MMPYRIPSFRTGVRMLCGKDGKRNSDTEWRIYYAGDSLSFFSPQQQILRWRSEWRLVIRRHSALLADGSQLTANSSQLIADSFYLLTVSLTMTPYHPRLFWTGARIPCGKDGKRNSDTEWRIYYAGESLPISSLCQWIICYPNDMKKRGNKKEMPAAINAAGISFIVCIQ